MAATYSSLVGVAVGGKYEIRRVLGAGGMGVVCEAVHLDLGKRVAIKLIDKTMKESELIVTRFRREARAAGQIQSEHIVDVFDVGADPRVGLYMVMEFLVGEDLQSRLERDKRLDIKTAVMVAQQIARGLAKAHEVGVIHRDLKPANVFLTNRDNGQLLVKLLDFGVSKLLGDDPGSGRITGAGAPIGTPLYMAPEQAEGREGVDGRADVWSLGAVLYEALAGAPPFADRGSYHGTIVGILTSRPKLLHDAAPWVPPAVAAVVDAMLVHDPDARIPSAAAVAQRLLDAFPTVLPDGTGHLTAVIVSQAAAAVDATGDTEIFQGGSRGALARPKSGAPAAYPDPHAVGPPSQRSFAAASASAPAGVLTIPDTPAPSEALVTGSATPVGPHLRAHGTPASPRDFERTLNLRGEGGAPASQRFPAPPSTSGPVSGRAPKQTAPLPPSAGSSGQAPAMPLTPAAIDPLPASSGRTDPTVATRPVSPGPKPRSRLGTFLFVLVAIVVVAIVGFIAGRHVSGNDAGGLDFDLPWAKTKPARAPAPPPPSAPPAPSASAPPPAVTEPPPSASAAPLPAPPPTASAAPSASASTRPPAPRRRPRPAAKPAESADEIPASPD